jgi:multidrug efflux pump
MQHFNLSAWAVKHQSFVLFLMISLGIAGVASFLSLGRAEDPSFTIKTMTVSAFWPGATSEQMQSMVADKLEKTLQDLPYFDFAKTFSRPGSTWILLNIKDYTPADKVSDIWYQARKRVQDIRTEMPAGVIGPFFNDEFGDVYSGLFAITGSDFTMGELKRIAESARQRLIRIADVDKVAVIAAQDEKIYVEFSHAKLASLGIAPGLIFDSLAKQNAMQSAGSVDTASDRIFLRVEGAFDAVEQVRAVPIQSSGKILRLGDIAEVKRGYEEPSTYTMRFDGTPAVGLGVVMSEGGNVLDLGEAMKHEVEAIQATLPAGVELQTVAFQPHVVEESVTEFLSSFVEALAIVLFVSFVSLGFRTGIVVALSVPLVLSITFVVMEIMGINLDRISLGSLIIALGLLVDDAIIAVEMMVVKMEQGFDRFRAATFAWSSTAFPMLTGTLVTGIGFVPVGFAHSSAGEYAGGIFWVVGIALIASWFVAVIFTPYLGVKLLPAQSGKHHDQDVYDTPMYRTARRILEACLGRPKTVVALTAMLFAGAMAGFPYVTQQFFPQSSRPEFLVELRLPEGASFAATESAIARVEELLKDDPDVLHFSSYAGGGPPRFVLTLDPDLPAANFGKIVVVTESAKHRERALQRMRSVFAENKLFPELRGRAIRMDFGPPVGFPVQYRVVGPDPKEIRRIARELQSIMQTDPDTVDVQMEWGELSKFVRLDVDQDRARLLGLTPQDLSQSLQTLMTGIPITQYREGTELIDVVARAVPTERMVLDDLQNINITTLSGKSVPLSQVASLRYEQEEPVLWRRNSDLTLTVRCDIRDGTQPPQVSAQLNPKVAELAARLPEGYRIENGGATEEAAKANASIFAVFPVMGILMLTVLMAQLQSFPRMFLVVLIAPLGLIGVVIFLLAFNAPFGFVALLGVISLAGMDMRNSVILMDQIQQDLADGHEPWEAVVGATVRRARPVILTAATAILAMIPLSRSVFWGPMAIAIMGGLSIATFLTLINLPALYVILFRVKRPASPSIIDSSFHDEDTLTDHTTLKVGPAKSGTDALPNPVAV